MNYQYGQEARGRISALGPVEISEFIDEIPVGLRKPFYDRQAAIPGFRKGTLPEFKKKQERLINHLVHPQGGGKGEADWKLFASFWVAWARNRLDVAFASSDEPSFQPDAGVAFLAYLSEKFPDTSRETIQRLILFSGFAQSTETLAAVNSFQPASTLARDRMIDGLPGRLDKIEGHIEIAEPAAEEAAKRIDQLESDLSGLFEQVAVGLDKASSEAGQLRSAMSQVVAGTEHLEHAVANAGKQSLLLINTLEDRVGNYGRTQSLHSDRLRELAIVSLEVREIKETISSLQRYEPIWSEISEVIEKIDSRLESLEEIISKSSFDSPTKQKIRVLETVPPGPFIDISNPHEACELIAWNLQACGVVKGSATETARQILAALTAGQIINFTGSIADLVADSVAAAVGGPVFHEWRVPVGLVSDEAAAECLDILGEVSGCLVLKGANRSAFEVYGAAIRDVVVSRQYNSTGYCNLALITSWTQGPAAFPDGGVLAELGPVFDTDIFRMRGVGTSLPATRFGHLVSKAWISNLDSEFTTVASLITDFREKLRSSGFTPGNLWLRSAERALVRLRTLPGASEEQDLHSLMTFWALPWARAIEGPAEDICRVVTQILTEASRNAVPPQEI